MRIKNVSDLKVGMVLTHTEYTLRAFMDPKWKDTVTLISVGPKRTRYHHVRQQLWGNGRIVHDGNHTSPTDSLLVTLKTFTVQDAETGEDPASN